MDEVLNFLKDCQTYFIASVEDNKPRVRPFGFVMEHEGKLYFVTGNFKPFYKQLTYNPYVELCALNKDFQWMRVSGKAVFDDRMDTKKKAFEVYPDLAQVYESPDNLAFECFYLDEAEAVFYSMITEPRTVSLG